MLKRFNSILFELLYNKGQVNLSSGHVCLTWTCFFENDPKKREIVDA